MVVVSQLDFYPSVFSIQSQCILLLCSKHGQRWKILSYISLSIKPQGFILPFHSSVSGFIVSISVTCDSGFHVNMNMCIYLLIPFITAKQDWGHFKVPGHWMLLHQIFTAITLPHRLELCRYQNKRVLKTFYISTHSLSISYMTMSYQGKKFT